jgi:hypothetical protein
MTFTRVFLLLALACSVLAADFAGKWKATMRPPDGGEAMEILFTFKVEGSTVTGTVSGPMGEVAISDGKIEGETLTFKAGPDENMQMVHKATISGNEMKIKVEGGDQTFEMTAKQVE